MQNLKEGRKSKLEEKQGIGDGRSGETLRRKDKSLLILAVTSYEVSMGQPLRWLIHKDQRIPPGRCLIPREGGPSSHLISSPLDSFTSFFLFSLLNISISKEHVVLFLKICWVRSPPKSPCYEKLKSNA